MLRWKLIEAEQELAPTEFVSVKDADIDYDQIQAALELEVDYDQIQEALELTAGVKDEEVENGQIQVSSQLTASLKDEEIENGHIQAPLQDDKNFEVLVIDEEDEATCLAAVSKIKTSSLWLHDGNWWNKARGSRGKESSSHTDKWWKDSKGKKKNKKRGKKKGKNKGNKRPSHSCERARETKKQNHFMEKARENKFKRHVKPTKAPHVK